MLPGPLRRAKTMKFPHHGLASGRANAQCPRPTRLAMAFAVPRATVKHRGCAEAEDKHIQASGGSPGVWH